MQYFYINGRYVRNRTMMAGMEMAFKGTTMQGKFPGGILLLEMPADLVDVNVHPAKTEVRFAYENDIFDLVYHAVKLALAQPGTGERQFAFEDSSDGKTTKEAELSNNTKENENTRESTVKKNYFTGLSAVISGQAEPGTLENHPKTPPASPEAGRQTSFSGTLTQKERTAVFGDVLAVPIAAETSETDTGHSWTKVAPDAPLRADVALHSPEPETPKKSEAEPPFIVKNESELFAPEIPSEASAPSGFRPAGSESSLDVEPDMDFLEAKDQMAAWSSASAKANGLPEQEVDWRTPVGTSEQIGFVPQDDAKSLRYVGEIFKTYILAEQGDELCLIDKHAAHERQLFEKLAASYGDVPSQLLLEPIAVDLSAEEKQALMDNIPLLENAGIEIDDFGGNTVFLRSVPADVEQGNAEDLLVELADKLARGSRDALSEKTEWVLHSISCRAAVKAGDRSSPQELMALAEKILSGEVPPFCPHGRPCVLKLTRKELEKQFGRLV